MFPVIIILAIVAVILMITKQYGIFAMALGGIAKLIGNNRKVEPIVERRRVFYFSRKHGWRFAELVGNQYGKMALAMAGTNGNTYYVRRRPRLVYGSAAR